MCGRRVTCFVLTLLILAAPLAMPLGAQEGGRAFTSQDAVDVRTVRVADVTPDGRWIAATVQTRRDRSGVDHFRFGDPTYIAPATGELWVVDAGTGASRSVFAGREQLRGATWSPDGRRLAFFRLQGNAYRLYVYDPASGRASQVTLRTSREIASGSPLVWSPDGGAVLVALRPDGWTARARQAFLELTEGPIVVQDSRDDFLDWDRVRGLDREQVSAVVKVSDGSVTELPLETAISDPHFGGHGAYLVYGTADPERTSYERAEGTRYGLFRLPLGGGGVDTLIVPREQRLSGEWNDQVTAFAWADRGNVFVRTLDGDSAVNLTSEYRTPVSAEDTTKLSYSLEAWRPDGDALLLTSKQGYHLVDVASGSMEVVLAFQGEEDDRPRLSTEAWSADGRFVYLSTSARDTWERGLVRLDVGAGEGRSCEALG